MNFCSSFDGRKCKLFNIRNYLNLFLWYCQVSVRRILLFTVGYPFETCFLSKAIACLAFTLCSVGNMHLVRVWCTSWIFSPLKDVMNRYRKNYLHSSTVHVTEWVVRMGWLLNSHVLSFLAGMLLPVDSLDLRWCIILFLKLIVHHWT